MSLSEDLKNKALKFLDEKWTADQKQQCQVCHSETWNVHSDLYELRTFRGGNLVVGGPLIPLLVVECRNCGNTLMINAIKAGLVETPEKKDSNNE